MNKLTKEQILNMPAGREIDALIAERVMGWTRSHRGARGTQFYDVPGWGVRSEGAIPDFSTKIAAAWLVVEKMTERDDGDCGLITTVRGWSCEFGAASMKYANAETAPLAICRAALLATMEGDK